VGGAWHAWAVVEGPISSPLATWETHRASQWRLVGETSQLDGNSSGGRSPRRPSERFAPAGEAVRDGRGSCRPCLLAA